MLKVGIVGAGGIASAHIEAYLEFPDAVEIVAISDLTLAKATVKRDAHGLRNARVYDGPDAMLAGEQLDLVSIVTPPSSHAPLAIQYLRHGVNVIVEKPMAASLEECDAMLAAAAGSGKILSVVAQNRYRDDMATLKEVLATGLIGSISHVKVDSSWWRAQPYYDLWWRGTWASEGGGCTLNHAIHHIDLLLWLLGRPRAVAAMMTNAQHDNAEVEDLSVAILQYDRALAELTSSVVHHGEEQAIVVQGARARISQPWRAAASTGDENGFPVPGGDADLVAQLDALAAAHAPLGHLLHAGQIANVLAAIRGDAALEATGADGRTAIELVTAIYQAAIERRTVDLPLSPENPYYRSGGLESRAPHFFEKTGSRREQGAIIVGASSDAG
ncbi:MAG: Gfo/Idh/MocA family oxidoreductase [Microbacterium sp.]|uniref:Gfo/Idh/MocA family protein n=1 Tax=Microbacterium sp. TaxID=51671 RepID=UPI0039E6A8BE